MKTTFVIMTGMHRTGTSMLSGAMGICGLDIGTNFRPEPHPCNPKGYFEDLNFRKLNLKLMRSAGIGPGSFVFPPKWEIVLSDMRINEIMQFVKHWDRGHPVGWKDPRACLTLHLWKRYLPRLKVITISRPAIEIAHSLKTRRPDFEIKYGIEITELYLRELEMGLKGVSHIDVRYHDFFKTKKLRDTILSGLCDFVGVDPVKGWADKVEEFIDKKLWRERQSIK